MRSKLSKNLIWTAVSLIPVVTFAAENVVAETRETLKEWVRVESDISREATAWKAEKQILLDRIELLKEEEERLNEQIEEAKSGLGEVDDKRAELTAEREAIQAVTASIREPLARFEAQARSLYARFPVPLQQETQRLFERIPEDPEKTRLSVPERLQAVVGLLNFADKFNSGVQREVEIRTIDGQQVEVETLYFGLAGAYYADGQGRHAGVGRPGADGWQWTPASDSAKEIAQLIAVYNGTQEAAFSLVPVQLP